MGARSAILAALAAWLTADSSGNITHGNPPAAGDNSNKLTTTGWFKAEQATETVQGTAKVATQAVTNAGTDDATIVTPKKLRAGFAASYGASGYIAFPTWLGGLIIQWGNGVSTNGVMTQNLPIAFPIQSFAAAAGFSGGGNNVASVYSLNQTQIVVYGYIGNTGATGGGFGSAPTLWIALGR
jgi:hypothetical protein